MPLYRRSKSNNWWVKISLNGELVRRSTGTSDKAQAQKFHDELKAQLWNRVPSKGSWNAAVIAWLKAAPRSESDRYSIRALNYKDRPLEECTRESFEKALADKSPATFNRYRAIIQAILHLADIHIKIPIRKTKSQRLRFLTKAEWERLYSELPEHLKPLAQFALATGMRQQNVLQLQWKQVDINRRVAWIHPDQAKAGKPIGVPLSDEAINVLNNQAGKSKEWIFPYKGRGRAEGMPIQSIKKAWKSALARAEIEDFTWHGLRHTWAAWHIMSGTPLEVLKELGGWASLSMVMQYAHLAPEHLARFANNAKPYEG